jgi:hypothetical protein
MSILKLAKHDEAREIRFELSYLLSLSVRQRFEMMFRKNRELHRLFKNENRKTPSIIKRT